MTQNIQNIIQKWANGDRPQGIHEHALAALTRAASLPYRLITDLRNLSFDKNFRQPFKLPYPVISIGNLSTGGTGKTPIVMMTAEILRDAGRNVAILSRGYHRKDTSAPVIVSRGDGPLVGVEQSGDEPYMLAEKLQGITIAVHASRKESARLVMAQTSCDTFVLDDGFQHRQMARDLDIVLWDALRPLKSQSLLPRGILREPLSNMKRAHAMIITKQNLADASPQPLIEFFKEQHSDLQIFIADAHPGRLKYVGGPKPEKDLNFQMLAQTSMPCAAFCSIGNPHSFWNIIGSAGIPLKSQTTFPDHHTPTLPELQAMSARAARTNAQCILTTEKDVQNLPVDWTPPLPLYAVELTTRFRDTVDGYRKFLVNHLEL